MSFNGVKDAYNRAMQEHHRHATPPSANVMPSAYSGFTAKDPDSRLYAPSQGNKPHVEPLSDKEMARLNAHVRGNTDYTEAVCKKYRMEDNEASVRLAKADRILYGSYERDSGFYPVIGQEHLHDPYAERRVSRPLEGPNFINAPDPMVNVTWSSGEGRGQPEGQLPEEHTRDKRTVGRGDISRPSNTDMLSSGMRKPSTPSRPSRRTTSTSSPSSHSPSDPSTISPRRSSRRRCVSSKLALANMADSDAQQSNQSGSQAPVGAGKYHCLWRQRYGGTCRHSFDSVQAHDRHVLSHIPDEDGVEVCNYRCLRCGEEFPRDDSCIRHLRETHEESDIKLYCEELNREWWWPVDLFYSPKYKNLTCLQPAPRNNTLSREQWMDGIVARYPEVVEKPYRHPKFRDDTWEEDLRNARRVAKRKKIA